MNWMAYNEFAWTDDILAPPETYEEEALIYVDAIKNRITAQTLTMLHLGCGAGGHDFHFKEHFSVTGADISEGMLALAKKRNPEVTYITGDMRNIDLNKKFDVVIIPDSIMYMTTIEDLKKTIINASCHLKPGGILLVVAQMEEDFRENNFAYSGEKENIHITAFENNHIVSDSTYEATIIYLVRQDGELSVHHEVHILGLFPYDQWMAIFEECQLKADKLNLDHLYDQYLLEDGGYKLKVFIGTSML